jgi:hypothetical protein
MSVTKKCGDDKHCREIRGCSGCEESGMTSKEGERREVSALNAPEGHAVVISVKFQAISGNLSEDLG